MKILILSDLFSLESWLVDRKEPKIMPAVYEFYNYLGQHPDNNFHAIIMNSKVNKTISFQNGSTIQLYKSRVPIHYFRKLVSIYQYRKKAQKLLRENQIDVIYGMSIYSIVARSLGKKYGIFSVGRLFGSLIYDVIKKGQRLKLYSRYFFQYLEAIKPCDLTICTEDGTEFDKAIKRINDKHNLHLLYNGINPSLRKGLLSLTPVTLISKQGPIKILYSGRLTNWKRQDLAIDTVSHLVHHYGLENIQLCILGKGEKEKRVRDLIKKERLEEKIHVKSPVNHSEIPRLLEEYQIFLSMYDASNLSNSIWEAALSGRLICTRATGKTNEIFKEGENAIVALNGKEMADKIYSFLDKDLSQLTDNSRSKIDQLIPDWKDRFEYELSLIHQLTETK